MTSGSPFNVAVSAYDLDLTPKKNFLSSAGSPATVWIAHDTRPSWKELVSAACQGVESVGGRVEVKGLLTTPQLHWMVRQRNKGLVSREDDYYKALAEAYRGLTGRKAATQVSCLF